MHWTEIIERRIGDVLVLELKGYLTLSEEDRRLMPKVAELLLDGRRAFLLNLRHVSYIDSPGIGEIVGAYTRAARQGGTLRLCEVSPRIREVLRATTLDTILVVYDTEEEAVRAMGGDNVRL